MSEKDNKNINETQTDENREKDSVVREFVLDDASFKSISSSEKIADADDWMITDDMDEILELDENASSLPAEDREEETEESDPIFKELADPKLPDLPKENRARLQMQSPTKLYFYWSMKSNPFQTLDKAFGGKTGSYTLVAKLVNKSTETEQIFSVEPEGNWWFDVDSDSKYQAEIGFYAPNRPYFRVMFSNEINTPRKSPSKRRDYTPYFNLNANEFAEVLDAAGYQRDAFEVAFSGDDEAASDAATQKTYASLTGETSKPFGRETADEMRFALLAFASGYSLDQIREDINPSLYNKLQAEGNIWESNEVLNALKRNFEIYTDELFEEEEFGDAIFGASVINFPKRIKKRSVPNSLSPKKSNFLRLSPLSSSTFKKAS